MDLMATVLKEFNNTYAVGDKVTCSFGLGTIIDDLGVDSTKNDHMYRVEFAPHIVQRNKLQSNVLVLGSANFSNRVNKRGMLESSASWDYMLDKDYETPYSDSWNTPRERDDDSFVNPTVGKDEHHRGGYSPRLKDEDYPPEVPLDPEELEHLLAQKQELEKKIAFQMERQRKAFGPKKTTESHEANDTYERQPSVLKSRLMFALDGARQDSISIDQLYERVQQACLILNPNKN